jgi:hypothetical protein
MHVAGSVAERALAGRGNAESGSMDFDAFRERFRDEWSKEEILREWEEAKKAVERDLESPAVKREIRALALELELEGKLFDYSFVVENAVQKDGKG